MSASFEIYIQQYRSDLESVYQTWFINNEERLKAFRSIKNGINQVVEEVERNQFGNDFKGSSLEVVMNVITEQKQVFEGAAHAFYWKPKLRIPDIYENEENKKTFARFLKTCLQLKNKNQLIAEVNKLNAQKIKGLGPAVANLLYFLHPTIFPPFNTAIVNGFNTLFKEKIKLGSWTEYLRMREVILDFNSNYSFLLSKDLGAVGGLLFEIGIGRLVISENHEVVLQKIKKQEKTNRKRHSEVIHDALENHDHSEMQYHLARLGKSLGYHVWISKNDHKREWNNQKLGEWSYPQLSLEGFPEQVKDTVALIDVLWLDTSGNIICAFEVEKSTSIYSGILRLYDLALTMNDQKCKFYLVAPDKREKEIKAQLLRPSFQHEQMCSISYILFSDLRCDCDAMCKFGENASVLDKISLSI
jgi:type II restriction enzyme